MFRPRGRDRTTRLFRCRAGRLRPQAVDGSSVYLIGQRISTKIVRADKPQPQTIESFDQDTIPANLIKSLRHTCHELNNLLTAAFCTGDLLQSSVGASSSVRKHADDLRQILEDIATLSGVLRRSIQDASGKATPQRSPVQRLRERRGKPGFSSSVDRLLSISPADR